MHIWASWEVSLIPRHNMCSHKGCIRDHNDKGLQRHFDQSRHGHIDLHTARQASGLENHSHGDDIHRHQKIYTVDASSKNIYTTDGRLIKNNASDSDINSLSKGIYIIGNKTRIVK